ncbi:MAG: hypothetical protein H7Y43_11880 [Akkermansiaceae bacterium]|nr:hypothetical protein [Verrucomicrobiales bacterium]
MIHFFAKGHSTLGQFVERWAPDLRPHVSTCSYRGFPFLHSFPMGSYIFADYERLGTWTMSRISRQALRLQQRGVTVLNDPQRYVSRFKFLKELHRRGLNRFQVYRVNEPRGEMKFPVFLRSENDHRGSMSGLLRSPAEVENALGRLSLRNRLGRKHLMLVEYCDCFDPDGVFRKYSAMNIKGALIPRHVLFSRNWVTKKPDIITDAGVAEEHAFLETFPHRGQVAEAFRIAGIDYGRIDYGMRDGWIQVWEINTNPVVIPSPADIHPLRLSGQTRSARQIAEALLALPQ